MSKIIRATGYRELSHIIKTDDGRYYMVDSNDTFDVGYETMSFEWDEKLKHVSDWSGEYVEHYSTEEEMTERHYYICEHYEKIMDDTPDEELESRKIKIINNMFGGINGRNI